MNQYLIVGLGNPTEGYRGTKHSIGFRMVSCLADQQGRTWSTTRHGEIASGRIKNVQLTLLKLSTYMSLSGTAVRYWMRELKVPIENILICLGDLAFPFGTLRIELGDSAGGHNGLKHIIELLGTDRYPRLRFGIGHDYPRDKQIGYVLTQLPKGELADIPWPLKCTDEVVQSFCLVGMERTMNSFSQSDHEQTCADRQLLSDGMSLQDALHSAECLSEG